MAFSVSLPATFCAFLSLCPNFPLFIRIPFLLDEGPHFNLFTFLKNDLQTLSHLPLCHRHGNAVLYFLLNNFKLCFSHSGLGQSWLYLQWMKKIYIILFSLLDCRWLDSSQLVSLVGQGPSILIPDAHIHDTPGFSSEGLSAQSGAVCACSQEELSWSLHQWLCPAGRGCRDGF